MGRYRNLDTLVLATLAFLSACDRSDRDDGGTPAAIVERDSAGIHIVESHSMTAAPEWRLEDSAVMSIGVVDGDAAYTLHNVGGGFVLPDGRIVIANANTELRFYDRNGAHLRTAGREGEGPGEFKQIAGLVLARDTVYVYDSQTKRLSLFSLDGEYLRSEPIPEVRSLVGASSRLAAVAESGLVYVRGGSAVPRRDSTGMYRLRMANVRISRDRSRVDTLGITVLDWLTGNQQFMVPPFTRSSVAAASNSVVAVTDPDRYAIELWDIDTTQVQRIFRLREGPPALTRAAFDSAAREVVDREVRAQTGSDQPNPELREKLEGLATHLEPYATLPAYTAVLIDDVGCIWARRWSARGATVYEFDVFGPNGRPAGRAKSPANMSFLQVGPDYVLARERDNVGVEYVRLYRLKRGT
jgi:hypothetical protein